VHASRVVCCWSGPPGTGKTLLALAAGNQKKTGEDTLQEILNAPDRDELLDWLRHRPLLYQDQALGYAMLHAGLPPQWTIAQAGELAHEVENVLRSDAYREFLHAMYGNRPDRWDDNLAGMDRLRFITNCFTRLRFCTADGRLGLKEKGPPGSQDPAAGLPWFEHPKRASRDTRILFGHWSTLGYRDDHRRAAGVIPLDTGCAHGGRFTALRLEDARYFRLKCKNRAVPWSSLAASGQET